MFFPAKNSKSATIVSKGRKGDTKEKKGGKKRRGGGGVP